MRVVSKPFLLAALVVTAVCHVRAAGAFAQLAFHLMPALTNQGWIDNVSLQFGIPSSTIGNDAGDLAILGLKGTGVYYRKAGTERPVRVIQYGDPVPGLGGSRVLQLFGPMFMNSTGTVAFRADVATTNRLTHAILTFDGTTLQTVATGLDIAPNTGGKKYERTMSLLGLNNSGDVLINATLVPTGATVAATPSVFLIPASGVDVRIAGPGDSSPTGGTFTAATGVGLNDLGQVLFNASIAGGSGATGIFVWKTGAVRKVVAAGDPNTASGGTFSDNFTAVPMTLNNAGTVAFVAGFSLWINTELNGTSEAVGPGDAVPVLGGVFSAVTGIYALSANGDIAFPASKAGFGGTSGLYLFRSGSPLDAVVSVGDAVPNQPGNLFNGVFNGVSVNASGTVSFQGNYTFNGAAQPVGFYQKTVGGALTEIAAQSENLSLTGTLFAAGFPTQTLSSGAVLLRAHIMNGVDATHALFLWTGTLTPLFTTADPLPFGARLIVRPVNLTASWTFIGMNVQLAGGRESVGIFNPVAQYAAIVATDGDVISGTSGGRLQLGSVNTVLVNAHGNIALQANLFGGNSMNAIRPAILAGGTTTVLTTVMISGETVDDFNRVLTSPQLNAANGVRPNVFSQTGQVAFTAVANGVSRGVYVGTTHGLPPETVALPGDTVSTGAVIQSVGAVVAGINEDGWVLFSATTPAGVGLFMGGPAYTADKVVQVGDPAPGGGTFSGFGATPMPAFNYLRQVAFVASTSGGSGGGVFLASPGAILTQEFDIEAVALNGSPAPGGGTFAITTPWGDVDINNGNVVAFRADLSGGTADSGIFVRPGALQPLEAVALQGSAAPGTPDTFNTFTRGSSGYAGELLQVSVTGRVAFFGATTSAGGSQVVGYWHRELGGTVQPIVIVPSSSSALDGGTAASLSLTSNWLSTDHYAVWIASADGPHEGGIYLYGPLIPLNVPASGIPLPVQVFDYLSGAMAQVTFPSVSVPGNVTFWRSSSGPPVARGWYLVAPQFGYYVINSTVVSGAPVEVCIDISSVVQPTGAVFRLLHYANNVWVDVTTAADTVFACGSVAALSTSSTFAVVMALNTPTTNIIQNGTFANGITGWSLYANDGTSSTTNLNYIQWAVNSGVFEYYKVASGPNSAVILQNTGMAFQIGDPIVASFEVGNTSPSRKRLSVLIHAADFSDLAVCTFWVPGNTPLRRYAMRTHTTVAWPAGASISIYAASGGAPGEQFLLDNIVMGPGHEFTTHRTDCVDPSEPGEQDGPDGPALITNGDFSAGMAGWDPVYGPATQVTGGVLEFARRSSPAFGAPSGVVLQHTQQPAGIGQVVTATFKLGNPTGTRHRVTVLLHDFSFTDLKACTFWLPPGQALSTYVVRTYTTVAWTDVTIAFYPASNEPVGYLQLDDVAMSVTPASPTYGTDCEEPDDASPLPPAPAPVSSPLPAPPSWPEPALPAETSPVWAGVILVDRRFGVA